MKNRREQLSEKEGGEEKMSDCHIGGKLGYDAGKFEACMECDNFVWCASETQSRMSDIEEKARLSHMVNRYQTLPRKRRSQRL
jgi:hypothetical protein